jgi:biofilm PGA synthesis N-glycosyltransferase PgaC
MQLTDEEDLLCGPVSYLPRNAMVSKAVELDLLSLTAMAGSTIQLRLPLLANGANMVYRKSAFNQLNGYDAKGGYDQASGDDIFLLKKIAEQPEYRIGYAKNRAALVETQMSPNLKAFVQQRIRWASKNKRTIGEPGSYLTFLLTLCYVFFAMSPIAAILFSSAGLWALVLVTWMMKFLVDYGLFSSVSKTFQKEHLMKYLWLAELLHPYYIVFTAALSLILPYTWKDRTIING